MNIIERRRVSRKRKRVEEEEGDKDLSPIETGQTPNEESPGAGYVRITLQGAKLDLKISI